MTGSGSRVFFVVHVVLLLGGAGGLAASLVELSRAGAAASGIALALSGAAAIAAGRSAVASRGVAHRLEGTSAVADQARRANAWVIGVSLVSIGALAAVFAMWVV